MAAPVVPLTMMRKRNGRNGAGSQKISTQLRAIGAGSKEADGKGQKKREKERMVKEKERAKEKERRKEERAAKEEKGKGKGPKFGACWNCGPPLCSKLPTKGQG